jgi:hypothetical protein
VRFARIGSVVLVVALIAGPALAANKPNRGECKRMTRQIARYERDARWADQRGNELWQDASKDRVEELKARREDRCAQYKKKRNPLVAFGNLVAGAAKAAAPWVIPGL